MHEDNDFGLEDLPKILPWLAPTLTSDEAGGERVVHERDADTHPLQWFFGMPRCIVLQVGGHGACSMNGVEGPLVQGFVQKPCRTVRKLGLGDSQIVGAILESGIAHMSGFERDQLLLLPEAVDDYVGSDNPVRFIDAFVDELDLVEAGFRRVQPKATGRPGYAPGDLLKLYIYGYLNRVRSSRRPNAIATSRSFGCCGR